jgi:hypothetical protein
MDDGLNVKKSAHCGFDLCPKKYKYLANPQLLETIYNESNSIQIQKIKSDDKEDLMIQAMCRGCNKNESSTNGWSDDRTTKTVMHILRMDCPLCITCRSLIQ